MPLAKQNKYETFRRWLNRFAVCRVCVYKYCIVNLTLPICHSEKLNSKCLKLYVKEFTAYINKPEAVLLALHCTSTTYEMNVSFFFYLPSINKMRSALSIFVLSNLNSKLYMLAYVVWTRWYFESPWNSIAHKIRPIFSIELDLR